MKKRIVSILLAVMMIVGMLPLSAITAMAAEQQYPIMITGEATYSDMTFDMSGKNVEHIFVIDRMNSGVRVEFRNITFMNVSGTGNGSCVYIDTNDYVIVEFKNCRFINCSASGSGGAVYINNVGIRAKGFDYERSYVSFSDCDAVNCRANGDGGFMYVYDEDASVYGNGTTVISGCTAGGGGGIYMDLGKTIDGFILVDNTATTGDGGGVCSKSNTNTVLNCRFYRNTAKVDGGGLYTDGQIVDNCKFFENECSDDGYELCAWFGSARIENCTFTSNYADSAAAVGGTQSNCSFPAKTSYALTDGTGSKDDPYIIDSTDDWDAFHYMVLKHSKAEYSGGSVVEFGKEYDLSGKYFRLDADINAFNTIGESYINSSMGYTVKYEFNGIFDGSGHTVTCYLFNDKTGEKAAFGYANGATVKDLYVDGHIRGNYSIGGIFGNAWYCTAKNCTNNATIYGTNDFVGGIAGYSFGTSFINCTNNGIITSEGKQVGGIAGRAGSASLKNCINNRDVTAYLLVGGLLGYEAEAVTVENCIVMGKVSATAPVSKYPAEGDYVIYSAFDNKYCFDIKGASLENGEYLNLLTAADSVAKIFTLIYDEQNDSYIIKAKHSQRMLTADHEYPSQDYVGVCQYREESQMLARQRWTFEPNTYGYKIHSVANGWSLNVANGTACDGAGIIAYKYAGNDSFSLVAEPNQEMFSLYSDAITAHRHSGSKYENIYYNRSKNATGDLGIGLLDGTMHGNLTELIGGTAYIMPNIINDAIMKNAPGTQGYMPVYFDENHDLTVAHSIDETTSGIGVSGKTTEYCIAEDVTTTTRPAVNGNVLLFLKDGCTLNAKKGITLESGNTLNVYASADLKKAGKLIATAGAESGNAGIGGIKGQDGVDGVDNWSIDGERGTSAGTMRVYGGDIYASGTVGFGGGQGGIADIPHTQTGTHGFGGDGGNGGTLYLYDGQFKATGSTRAIGGGNGGLGGFYQDIPSAGGANTVINEVVCFFAQIGENESNVGEPFTVHPNTDYGFENRKYAYLYHHTHNYDSAAYEWSEDYTKCTATLFCSGCPDDMAGHIEKTVTVNSKIERTDATCTEKGYTVYTAVFEHPFENQEKTVLNANPTGHRYYEYFDDTFHKCQSCGLTQNHSWKITNTGHVCSICDTNRNHFDDDKDDRCDFCGYLMAVTYLDKTVIDNEVVTKTKTVNYPNITVINNSDETWGMVSKESWYVLDGDITLDGRPVVKGNVHIILMDGKTLTANHGITVKDGSSLSIYAQSDDESKMGILSITTDGQTAIGGIKGKNGVSQIASAAGNDGDDGATAGIISFFGGKSILYSTGAVTVGGGNGGNGEQAVAGGNGGNGGKGGSVYFYGGCQTLIAVNANAVGGGNGGDGGDGQAYGGNGGNGGDGGSVYFYGGCQTMNAANASAIGGGIGGKCGDYDISVGNDFGKNGENGGNATVYSSLRIKAGDDADTAVEVESYDGQKYICIHDRIWKYYSYTAHKCSLCGDLENHVDADKNGICDICGYTGVAPYTAYDYLEVKKGAYIDTGYNPTENTRVVMKVYVNGSYEYWFGVWDTNYNQSAFALGNDGKGIYAGYGNQGGTNSMGPLSNGYHTVEMNKNEVYFDGVHYTGIAHTYSSEGFRLQNTLYLFAQNRKGSAVVLGDQNTIHCYGCEIYEGDTLVRKFVPAKKDDGTSGLLDTVSGIFYENNGSAAMTALNDENVETVSEAAPTCTENGHIIYYKRGFKYYTDESCSKEITDLSAWLSTTVANGGGMTPAIGHTKPNEYGKCDECGEAIVVIGDLDMDGEIDADDLALLKTALLTNAEYTVVLDCNGDGELNILDIVRMKKHLADETVPLGKQESEQQTEQPAAEVTNIPDNKQIA